jgi:mannitol-specific phosphotransferase system IIBC component
MNNQIVPYQFQEPAEPIFSKTVFFSVFMAILVSVIIALAVYYFVVKAQNKDDEPSETMEEIEEKKAQKSKNALRTGILVVKKEAADNEENVFEPFVEEV